MKSLLPSERPPKILVTRTDRLGDLILSTAVFSAIRKKYPQAVIGCLTFPENSDVVKGNPFIDEIIIYRKKMSEKGVLGNLIFAFKLAAKKYDAVVHLHATHRMHWLSWLAGIPVRIGYARKNAWTLTHSIPDTKKEGRKHEAEYNFDLLRFLDVPPPEKPELYFPLDDRAKLSLEELFRHLEIPEDKLRIVIHPSASCPSKKWPPEKFAAVCNKIAGIYDAVFLVVGTARDEEVISRMSAEMSAPFYDLSGRLSVAMLGQLLQGSALLISNDSGPVHISAALNRPVISVFGRNQPGLSPNRWKPLGEKSRYLWKDSGCRTCLAHLCEIHFLCLDIVSAEDVFELAADLLPKQSSRKSGYAVTQ